MRQWKIWKSTEKLSVLHKLLPTKFNWWYLVLFEIVAIIPNSYDIGYYFGIILHQNSDNCNTDSINASYLYAEIYKKFLHTKINLWYNSTREFVDYYAKTGIYYFYRYCRHQLEDSNWKLIAGQEIASRSLYITSYINIKIIRN
jgi:hypothetical protein